MTPTQFAKALAATRIDPTGKTAAAVRLALVDGMTDNAAARQIGVNPSVVTRARHKIQPRQCCPACGFPVPR